MIQKTLIFHKIVNILGAVRWHTSRGDAYLYSDRRLLDWFVVPPDATKVWIRIRDGRGRKGEDEIEGKHVKLMTVSIYREVVRVGDGKLFIYSYSGKLTARGTRNRVYIRAWYA